MLTLKHLARTLNLDPYALRQRLRQANLKPQVNGRWKWPDEQDPNYQAAKAAAQNPPTSAPNSSPKSTPTKASKSKTDPPTPSKSSQPTRRIACTTRPQAPTSS